MAEFQRCEIPPGNHITAHHIRCEFKRSGKCPINWKKANNGPHNKGRINSRTAGPPFGFYATIELVIFKYRTHAGRSIHRLTNFSSAVMNMMMSSKYMMASNVP